MTVLHRNFIQRLLHHFSPKLFSRYLVVGAINTAFGYGVYVLLVALFKRLGMTSDYALSTLASAVGNPVNITFSFLTYKFFVFKTQGHHLREYLRCWAVYGTSSLVGVFVLTPFCVLLLLHTPGIKPEWVSYLAGLTVLAFSTLFSFIGHSKFSFRKK
ncbi:TPA: hypothetical protein DDW35_00045 [Candidatus Sumerlaeota bacterium]|nr:hypothetical protein [Candidatus Sumerlaeota bacterium]